MDETMEYAYLCRFYGEYTIYGGYVNAKNGVNRLRISTHSQRLSCIFANRDNIY